MLSKSWVFEEARDVKYIHERRPEYDNDDSRPPLQLPNSRKTLRNATTRALATIAGDMLFPLAKYWNQDMKAMSQLQLHWIENLPLIPVIRRRQ